MVCGVDAHKDNYRDQCHLPGGLRLFLVAGFRFLGTAERGRIGQQRDAGRVFHVPVPLSLRVTVVDLLCGRMLVKSTLSGTGEENTGICFSHRDLEPGWRVLETL